MSLPLVSHSPDLQRLVDEGYELEFIEGHVIAHHVPFLTATRAVQFGSLISELKISGDTTERPDPHTVLFTGVPHDLDGQPLNKIINSIAPQESVGGLIAQSYLSSKPQIGHYDDYHAKLTQYIKMISGWAEAVDPSVTSRTFRPIVSDAEESVFAYPDSASSRAGISPITNRLRARSVGIVGLGGTGSYILDLVAKTPVPAIHLWDSDVFLAHNAYRAPGAASLDELNERPLKVNYFASKYGAMHRRIVPHTVNLDSSNLAELDAVGFVFLSMDTGPAKRAIIDALSARDIPFIDVGMGINKQKDALGGILRVTSSFPGRRDHIDQRISFAEEQDDEYDKNIQVADLNALNAAMAVIRWKKFSGFYLDLTDEMHSTYTVSGNRLLNSDTNQ